jgi:hypothetical protein
MYKRPDLYNSAHPFSGPLSSPCLPYGSLLARENNFCSAVCLEQSMLCHGQSVAPFGSSDPCLVTLPVVDAWTALAVHSFPQGSVFFFFSLPGPKVELFFVSVCLTLLVQHYCIQILASTMMRYLYRGLLLDGPAWTGSMLFVDATPPQT